MKLWKGIKWFWKKCIVKPVRYVWSRMKAERVQ